ncbi:DUF7472 family protein [Halorussus halobius]|uniref:DUF7472 family protein n=1 Tax=Halorussus halobius TaxID=1710537 RepID=UPI001091E2A5|nr:hypothetical protein [Halorussus halobius]
MDIDQETLREIFVGAASVGLFVALLYWVGLTYGGDALSETGGLAVVGVIVVFVAVMTAVGYWMSRQY